MGRDGTRSSRPPRREGGSRRAGASRSGDAALVDRAAAILIESDAPVSSARLAEALLGIVSAPEAAATAVLRPLLCGQPHIAYTSGEGWRAAWTAPLAPDDRPEAGGAEDPARPGADDTDDLATDRWRPGGRRARRFLPIENAETFDPLGSLALERRRLLALHDHTASAWSASSMRGADQVGSLEDDAIDLLLTTACWAIWEVDPALRAAAVVRLENGIVAGERTEVVPTHHSRHRGLAPAALRRLASHARGARWAHLAARRTILGLERALLAAGAGPLAGPAVGLARMSLALLGPPRPRSIEALAARLGERIVAAETPLERARAASSCFQRLLAIAAARAADGEGRLSRPGPEIEEPGSSEATHASDRRAGGRDGAAGSSLDVSEPAPAEERAWPGVPFGDPAHARRLAGTIAALPSTPGVYRFLAEDGALLYVGKAVDLRRRVSSYFHRRAAPDPRTAPWIGRVARIEIEGTGSEPEALVREAETILRASPEANTQRAVRDRRPAAAENLILLLPSRKRGAVHAHLLRAGAPVARVSLGPRGGGAATLRALLARHYFSGQPEVASQEPAAGAPDPGRSPRGGPENRGAGTDRGARAASSQGAKRRRAALFASWLARQSRPVSAFDPTDAASIDVAVRIALLYARGLRRGEQDVVYRA